MNSTSSSPSSSQMMMKKKKKKKKKKLRMGGDDDEPSCERMRRRKIYVEIKSKNVGFAKDIESKPSGVCTAALQNNGRLYCWISSSDEKIQEKIKPFWDINVDNDTKTQLLDGSDSKFRYGLGVYTKDERYCLYFTKSHVRDEWFSFVRRCIVMSKRHWSGMNYEFLIRRDERARKFATSEVVKVRSVPEFQRRSQLSKLLLRCSILYRFDRGFRGDSEEYRRARYMKSRALEHVKEYISKPCKGARLDEHETLCQILHMIASNLFRTLPVKSAMMRDSFSVFQTPLSPSISNVSSEKKSSKESSNRRTRSGGGGEQQVEKNMPAMSFDGGPEFSDPSWPHLQVCYTILRDLILTSNIPLNVKKKCVRAWFVKKLIQIFRSKDKRERTQVKLSVHRIYGTLTNRRSCIRNSVNESIYTYLYERCPHCGIFDMLEFLLSIVNGFGTPLRKEHLTTLKTALIPLHKMEDEPIYHDRLQYCMVLFATKDKNLVPLIISELLRLWPKAGSRLKVLGFLAEIDEILELNLSEKIFEKFRKSLAKRFLSCVSCDHSEIVLRTLHLIHHNKNIRKMFFEESDESNILLKELQSKIEENAKGHWSEPVRTYSSVVLSVL